VAVRSYLSNEFYITMAAGRQLTTGCYTLTWL